PARGEKEKPRRGGGKFVPVRRNFQDSRGSGGTGEPSSFALPCWTQSRCPGFKAKKNSTIVPLGDRYLAEGCPPHPQQNQRFSNKASRSPINCPTACLVPADSWSNSLLS